MDRDDTSPDGFTIDIACVGNSTILTPSGSLTFDTCSETRTALDEACGTHAPAIVLDCNAVAVLDSEALELLVEWHDKLSAVGGSLKLVNLNEVCSDILVATRLIHVFVVYDDMQKAVGGA